MTIIAATTKKHDLHSLFLREPLLSGSDEESGISVELSISGLALILHIKDGDELIAIESLPLSALVEDWTEQIVRNYRIKKKHEEIRKRDGLEG